MNELVQRLATGTHAVTIGGPQRSAEELQRRLAEIGYVFIQFPETRGGTNLGVRVDTQATDLSRANFTQKSGTVHIEGTLTLNYQPVRCVADIDLASLQGSGHLVVLETAHS